MTYPQITSTNLEQPIQEAQISIPHNAPLENPSAWMHTGYSPAEIILASAVLTSASIGAIATAVTGLVKALVPAVKPDTTHIINVSSTTTVQKPDISSGG